MAEISPNGLLRTSTLMAGVWNAQNPAVGVINYFHVNTTCFIGENSIMGGVFNADVSMTMDIPRLCPVRWHLLKFCNGKRSNVL